MKAQKQIAVGFIFAGSLLGYARGEETPVVQTLYDDVRGDFVHYAKVSDSDAARQQALTSYRQRCEAWKAGVVAALRPLAQQLRVDCLAENEQPTFERLGSHEQKGVQFSSRGIIKAAFKGTVIVASEIVIGRIYPGSSENDGLNSVPLYQAACQDLKNELWGQSLFVACGTRKTAIDGIAGSYTFSRGQILFSAEEGTLDKEELEGQTGLTANDGSQVWHPFHNYDNGYDDHVSPSDYMSVCRQWRATLREKFGARYIFASCGIIDDGHLFNGSRYNADIRPNATVYLYK